MSLLDYCIRLQQQVCRGHNPKWGFDPASGQGASRRGGRFNRIGVTALYTSLDAITALHEIQQGFVFKPQPVTICFYDVDCQAILDLTQSEVLTATGFDLSDLSCAWELIISNGGIPPTWELVDDLISSGIAGIIVPSYATGVLPGGKNLIFWNWNDSPPFQVKVIDDYGRLPEKR